MSWEMPALTWYRGYGGVQEDVRYYAYCELCDDDLTGKARNNPVDAESDFKGHMLFRHNLARKAGEWVNVDEHS